MIELWTCWIGSIRLHAAEYEGNGVPLRLWRRQNSFIVHGKLNGDDLRRVVRLVVRRHFKVQHVRVTVYRQRLPAHRAAIDAHDSESIGLERFAMHFFGERSRWKVDADRLAGQW